MPPDAAFPQGIADGIAGFPGRQPAERVLEQLHHLHFESGGDQIIGELAADQSGAQHHHPAAPGNGVAKARVIVEVVHRYGGVGVPGQIEPYWIGPQCQHQLAVIQGFTVQVQLLRL